ncbi:phage portal protein [Globicatella sulfidifaciens]
MVFVFDSNKEITSEVIEEFIYKHMELVPKYTESKNFYEGLHDILKRPKREAYKPDNRIVVNLAKYMVDTFNGFFNGIPCKETHENEKINQVLSDFGRRNDLDNHESELAKMTSIYGHAFEYMYQDDNAQTSIIYNSPLDMFIVYDDSIQQEPLFAVRYYFDDNQRLQGELTTLTHRLKLFEDDKGKIVIDEPNNNINSPDHNALYYDGLAVVEYIENEERMSLFESVKSMMNALNNAISAKADDVDYFADAYLVILGALLDEDTIRDFRANRTINMEGGDINKLVIEFLEKPSSDETQENLINRLLDLIFTTAMVINMQDEKFGAAAGIALENKRQPMDNLAKMKERKFQSSMAMRYKMLFSLQTNVPNTQKDEWINIKYQFTRNVPVNLKEEVEIARGLEGIVSEETQLGYISGVKDPQEEMEKKRKENPEPVTYDNFEKDVIDNGQD